MGKLMTNDIIEATGGRRISGGAEGFSGISIDSRTIATGELFVAIKGERFDGHDFIPPALKKGEGALLSIQPAEPLKGKTLICVDDTLKALQDIARFLRRKKGIPVIGITGTNGKTTTKEMISAILSAKHTVLKNTGNLNNQIGLPLSLVRLNSTHDMAVLEMGASRPGDIKELCGIAGPDYGVLTNIGYAHLEGFGSIETLRRTKLEMLDFVKTVAVNADDLFLLDGMGRYGGRVIRYAINNIAGSDIYAADIVQAEEGSAFTLHAPGGRVRVNLKVGGMFNIYNALAAGSISHALGAGLDEIRNGLEAFTGVPMRFEIKSTDGATVLSDVYNANPASMEEAVKEMLRLRGKRAVAVLGDMLELGSYAEEAHRKLGAWMSGLPVDLFIAVGPLMALAADEFSGEKIKAANSIEARRIVLREHKEGDTILVKGSRAMRMEEALKDAL
ncbi:MAG: UDP-N-acetylmuramoyl-tripeptide--D-alanyl-D-alanine ligase [Thermodesulfovibrionales bacterium]|nr:UDP-N-acetylmuramoyl-tripeptide--D-alanyl-D-alanine ligase [Thermodesulfovibrionales bacterium]